MKTIILLFLFLISTTILHYCFIREDFNNNMIDFLSYGDTYDLLSSNKEYYDTFYSNDFKVRGIKNIKDYMKKIQYSVVDFTEEEKDKILEAVRIADSKILSMKTDYFNGVKANNIGWKFGLTRGNMYEEGLPHTIKDTIILNKNTIMNDKYNLATTLVHEMVHIYQKKYPDDVKKYLEEKKFKLIKKREERDNTRANPDIDNNIYMKDNIIYKMVYHNNPSSILDVYQKNQIYEHPYETMAIEISRL